MDVILYPQFTAGFTLTSEQIDMLMACSSNHYDSVCREASAEGGFIYKWKTFHSEMPCNATFRQLDICLKCMEWPPRNVTQDIANQRRTVQELFNTICIRINEQYQVSQVVFEFKGI